MKCPGCDANFCLQHRHKTEHNCPELQKQPLKKPAMATGKSASSVSGQTGLAGSASKSGTWSSAKGIITWNGSFQGTEQWDLNNGGLLHLGPGKVSLIGRVA